MHNYRIPISDELKAKLNEVAKLVEQNLPEKTGFVLLVFPPTEPPTSLYISNVKREEGIKAMIEYIQTQGE